MFIKQQQNHKMVIPKSQMNRKKTIFKLEQNQESESVNNYYYPVIPQKKSGKKR